MPINHTRKIRLTELKTAYGVKHADAIALLDHPNEYERAALCSLLANTPGITTYKDALARLAGQDRALGATVEEDWDDPDACDCGYPLDEGRYHCCDCGAGHEYHCVC
ncbi:hypothetical protein ABZW10_35795 [Kitasatospora sp. NPDC004723]|uniref:hypothetical protein n=1 Tax=Kitasatospora sp. NPDC004723 TaxID=3154288 RepID=UPI0033B6F4BA